MARVLALAFPFTRRPALPVAQGVAQDVARGLVVAGCALALILAGVDLGL
ncbi:MULTISPECIES: hypothetical protein [Novosphingobium]|uniref:Uncharacterized protein n=1 Tax=Novosphingobium decolorationis TaxID=2698673 RepID=A0ABX8E611_9SPHN|nr:MULTISPECIES: hypothetical protein [Novosphingobium]QVM84616.1 hypothetical protein HT578_13845 [Novosphingobium decolorationis]GAM04398.1 hypothetical protein MBENS4_1396 [Novosphingobium sp. MBES04]